MGFLGRRGLVNIALCEYKQSIMKLPPSFPTSQLNKLMKLFVMKTFPGNNSLLQSFLFSMKELSRGVWKVQCQIDRMRRTLLFKVFSQSRTLEDIVMKWSYQRHLTLGGSGQRKKKVGGGGGGDETTNSHILRCLTQPGLGKFCRRMHKVAQSPATGPRVSIKCMLSQWRLPNMPVPSCSVFIFLKNIARVCRLHH